MKNTPYHVRLDDDQAKAVQQLAKKFRVKEIDVIRWAIDALTEYVKHHDGHLHLPIDLEVMWEKVQAKRPDEDIQLLRVADDSPGYGSKKRKA